MIESLNNSVVSASAFYDHHRHISKAAFQQAMAAESGKADSADPAALNDINPASGDKAKDEGGFSFFDFLDIINPLQHIPIVSSIYRALTGDEIHGPARILGGALYGGPVGLAMGAVNAMVDGASGHDVGEHVMMAFTGKHDKPDLPPALKPEDTAAPVMVAQAQKTDTDNHTEFGAVATESGPARGARTPAHSASPVLAAETARDAAMASSLLQENASRAEARAGDGAPTPPPSPAAQQEKPGEIKQASGMPTALQPTLAPGLVVQTMMQNLDAYGEMMRERGADVSGPVDPKAAHPEYDFFFGT